MESIVVAVGLKRHLYNRVGLLEFGETIHGGGVKPKGLDEVLRVFLLLTHQARDCVSSLRHQI